MKQNIAVLQLLAELRAEARQPTEEEARTLVSYSGWGGLLKQLKERQDDLIEDGVMTAAEWDEAATSALTAFYTPANAAHSIWELLRSVGYKGGRVLEPSGGTGVFLNVRPGEFDEESHYTAVELDPLTASILDATNPAARVLKMGLEHTRLEDDSFDLVIGNVPFGEFPVSDTEVPGNLSIHNYFLAKTLRKTRIGGVVAILTSPWTLDSKSPLFRQRIAAQADLVGAVRLPNGIFSSSHSGVLCDLLVFRKRAPGTEYRGQPFLNIINTELPAIRDLEWTDKASGFEYNYAEGESVEVPINEVFTTPGGYFGGTPMANTWHWKDRCIVEIIGDHATFETSLEQLSGAIGTDLFDSRNRANLARVDAPENPIIRTPITPVFGALVKHEGKVYQAVAANQVAGVFSVELAPTTIAERDLPRIERLIDMREVASSLLIAEREDAALGTIESHREALNAQYDDYIAEFGYLNESRNRRLLLMDAAGPMLLGLEFYDEEKKSATKSAIFRQRVITKPVPIESATSFEEAVAISMAQYGRVDENYVGQLLNSTFDEQIENANGVVFLNPENQQWEVSAVYLSGNVRKKLAAATKATESDPRFDRNIQALKAVVPFDIMAEDIKADLSSRWIPARYLEAFIVEACEARGLEVTATVRRLSTGDADCEIAPARYVQNSALVLEAQLGTPHRSLKELIEAAMSNRVIRVTRKVDEDTIFLREETLQADAKLTEIKDLFKAWIWQDSARTQYLERLYNDTFNAFVFQEFDGSHLTFPGLSPLWAPRAHQAALVARSLALGNSLAAHAVGAGKTFEMVALCIEKKRLGHCNRPLISVPNHMLYQMATEAMSFYPGARIALITKDDLRKENRRAFLARIAFNDWDLIVITHSTLARIGIPGTFEADLMEAEILKMRAELQEVEGSSKWSERRMQIAIKKKRDQLKALQQEMLSNSDGVTIADLGIDQICIDEAHLFKNLELDSAISLPGVANSASNRAWSLYLKTRYLYELHGDEKGVDFFTATPIANSIVELYTMGRYLKPSLWAETGINNFSDWVGAFGEVTSELEVLPEGGGFQMKARLNNFANVPELLTIFRLFADVKTREDLNLPVPKYTEHVVTAEPTRWQRLYMDDLTRRAKKIRSGASKQHEDNLLAIVGDGRRAAMDMRLIAPQLPQEEDTKIALFVDNAIAVYDRTKNVKGTQIIFCDVSTPSGKKQYDVYNDAKRRLLAREIPESEIAFIHDEEKDAAKLALFRRVNSGSVRFIFGSTEKLGVGTNIQERLAALHNLDAPWRPNDLEQRLGRIVRQGNIFDEVDIFNYTTKDSFDLFMWETNKRKARFITQIMRDPRSASRTLSEDTDINFAAVVAVTTGNPLIREKVEVDAAVAKLQRQEQMFYAQQSRQKRALEDARADVDHFEKSVTRLSNDVEIVLAAVARVNGGRHEVGLTLQSGVKGISDGPATFIDRKTAAKALWFAMGSALVMKPKGDEIEIGELYGVKLSAFNYRSVFKDGPGMAITIQLTKPVEVLATELPHNLMRKVIESLSADLPAELNTAKRRLAAAKEFLERGHAPETSFGKGAELESLVIRQRELNAALTSLEAEQHAVVDDEVPFGVYLDEYLIGVEEGDFDSDDVTEDIVARLESSLTQQVSLI